MSQIGLKQAFFTKQKHCPTQLIVLHHYSEVKTRDFIEIVSIVASNPQNAAFHRKDLKRKNVSNWPKTRFFHQTNALPDSTFFPHHYSEAKTRDFIEIVSILASNSQNVAFHRKDLQTQKCLKLA